MIIKKLNRLTRHKKLLWASAILVVLVSAFIILDVTGITHFISSPNNKSTNTESPAQSDFTGGKEREVINSDKKEGTITDTKGVVTTIPPESEWSSSSDNAVTVYSPAQNSILSSGNTLSGKSTAETISFRLIDSVSGVIAQGKISVVSGKFSGIFDYSTTATEGRLDVFIADANGIESSIVEIPVRFK